MSINCRELKRRYELEGPQRTVRHLSEALRQRHLRPDDFSLRDLAEALVPDGRQWVDSMHPRRGGLSLLESSEGLDTTAFANITGQVIYNKILEGARNEEFVATRLVETISTSQSGERIPGVGQIGDQAQIVKPGMPYPHVGFGEDWIETPATTKRGLIVPVTKEAIFQDRTGLILRHAAQVGEALGLNKEKRLLDVIVGAVNNFKWKDTAYNTYLAEGQWVNLLSENPLVDWTSIDAVEQAFAAITDPSTGEPILISGTTLLVPPALRATALGLIDASQVRVGDITSGRGVQTVLANPVSNYRVAASRLLKARLVAAGLATDTWFLGDFRRAFAYMENWPITVAQAPKNSEAEFAQDIVLRFKASECGVAAVIEPRAVMRSMAA